MIMCLQCGRPGFDPSVGKISWRGERQPTPGVPEFHGQRSLKSSGPWGDEESDTTEQLTLSLSLEPGKSKIKASADLVSGESLLSGS